MKKLVKILLCCVTIFIININSGCSTKTESNLNLEPQVHTISYQYIDCGDLKLNNIGIELESPKHHVGSFENQKILTKNLILLDYKLKEAESLLNCYKSQNKKKQ